MCYSSRGKCTRSVFFTHITAAYVCFSHPFMSESISSGPACLLSHTGGLKTALWAPQISCISTVRAAQIQRIDYSKGLQIPYVGLLESKTPYWEFSHPYYLLIRKTAGVQFVQFCSLYGVRCGRVGLVARLHDRVCII